VLFRHVVLFTWKPKATKEQKQAVHAELAKMPPAIEASRAGIQFELPDS
jgi:hypothetical protein